jgi:diadenosine tetraphosphate (Ap4A) HIT family hydrolase
LVHPVRHIEFTSELNHEEMIDFLNVEKYIREFYKNNEYFSFVRQTRSNKSVEHLHYHYIS